MVAILPSRAEPNFVNGKAQMFVYAVTYIIYRSLVYATGWPVWIRRPI